VAPAHAGTDSPNALQDTLERAAPGARVVIPAGVHRANLVIDKPLELMGEPGAVLDGGGVGDVIRVRSADVTIRGLTLRNSGYDLTAMNSAIHAERGADNLLIEGNLMENVAFGVWMWHLSSPRVIGNRIRGNPAVRSQDRGDGIRLFNVEDGEFRGNDIRETRDGVYIDTSRKVEFRDNSFEDLRYGIHYMYSHDGRIIGNRTRGTRSGYALMMSRSLEVLDNRSEQDRNYGILMNFVTYSTIAGNRIHNVTGWSGSDETDHGVALGAEGKALFVYNSLRNAIRDNIFADSEIGIHLTAGSEENEIHGNAFLRNRVQVKYVANRPQEWSYDGRGNHWSDYLGWDRNNDGVGDRPYEPNDSIDKVLWKYPLAKLLMNSPAVEILRWVQSQFPVLRSPGVRDSHPLMRPPEQAGGVA
jgi:nitrous oxidase accessory protein